MEQQLAMRSCHPIALTLFAMGPFQDKPFRLDFTNKQHESCNLYLLISPNGRGKTTLLEAMTVLMNLLDRSQPPHPPHERLWSNPQARAQLDLRLTVIMTGKRREILLTLAAGDGAPHETRSWGVHDLQQVQTEEQLFISWSRSPGGHWKKIQSQDPLLDELLGLVSLEMENVYEVFGADQITLPSLLYFDAYRDIPLINEAQSFCRPPEWFYRPSHRFGQRNDQWQHSLDNLLIWLTWLNDGRYEKCQTLLNELVFVHTNKALGTINRQYMKARITTGGEEHRLDQLSSSEKSLLQLLLRIHLHMTTHCFILIDELDAHLHPKLQHRIYQALKRLVVSNPNITLIMTTHARELIEVFTADMKVDAPGLRFGGHLIELDEI
ncbi:MAG: AAA family ATPase [Magnetococcales bacterium]|nr:AAA family ATPase [Magnetococcales bacterium]MBF0114665.1 AAA family ATPase [Magnetococcales bacterium]